MIKILSKVKNRRGDFMLEKWDNHRKLEKLIFNMSMFLVVLLISNICSRIWFKFSKN